RSIQREGGKAVMVSFTDCYVSLGSELLFQPEWGVFDMICGEKVASVFGGAADRGRYLAATGGYRQTPGQQKSNLTDKNRALNELYARVRELREGEVAPPVSALEDIHTELERVAPEDWLLRFE